MKYLNGTRNLVVTIVIENLNIVKWYIDVAFGVHPDYRSHTGATCTMGKGAIISMSKKQKLNTKSSTTAKLVGVDDAIIMVLWMQLFLDAQ